MTRWTFSEASNQSASMSGESARWPLNSTRSGSAARMPATAASHASASAKMASLFHVKRLSTSERAGRAVLTIF